MKKYLNRMPQLLSALLIVACIFGELFPFLNIDLGFETIKPLHSALVLVAFFCLGVWIGRIKKGDLLAVLKKEWKEWTVFAFFAVWFLFGAARILLGNTNSYAITEVAAIFVICLFAFCLFTLVRSIDDVYFLLRVCVFSGVILSLLSCVEVVIGSFVPYSRYFYTLEQKIELGQTLFSPTTVFHNQNDFAAFLLLCFAIVCFWVIRSKSMKDFWYCLAIAVLLMIPAILSNSAIFCLMAVFLIALTCIALLIKKGAPLRAKLIRIAAIVVAVALITSVGSDAIRSASKFLNKQYYTLKIQEYNNRGEEDGSNPSHKPGKNPDSQIIVDFDSSNISNPDTLKGQIGASQKGYGTIHTRMWLIRAGWSFFLQSPILGNGPESYRDMIANNEYYLDKTGGIVNPHFFYIELLSQYGILFFAGYMLIVLYVAIRALLQTIRELSEGRPGKGLICLLLVGTFSVAAIMSSSMLRLTVLWLFLLLAFCLLKKEEQTEEVQE